MIDIFPDKHGLRINPGKVKLQDSILVAVFFVLLLGWTTSLLIGAQEKWVNLELHSAIEMAGGMAATLMSLFLFRGQEAHHGIDRYLLAGGFLGMGILDSTHAISQPGEEGFFLLRSLSSLLGSIWFSLLWVAPKLEKYKTFLSKKAPWIEAACCIIWGLMVLYHARSFPFTAQGSELPAFAGILNSVSGVLFLAGAVHLFLDYFHFGLHDELLFAALAVLFGAAGLISPASTPWHPNFWGWHAMRLTAYFLALAWIIDKHQEMDGVLSAEICEHKQALNIIRQGEERFKAQYQNIPIPTFTWRKTEDGQDLELVEHNAAAAASDLTAIAGVAGNLNKRARDVFKSRPEIAEALMHCLVHKSITRQDLRGFRMAPEDPPLDIFVTRAFVPPDLVIAHIQDVTDRNRMEASVRARENMASLGRVTACIAHEIKNPLFGLTLYLNALEKICKKRGYIAEVAEILDELKTTSGKIEAVVRRVQDFTRPGELQMRPIDINEPVREVVELSLITLKKSGIEIETSLAENLPPCAADSHLIGQVIINLIDNAAQALGGIDGPRKISIRSMALNHSIRLTVADSGPGIPIGERRRIFDPFFTTRSDGSGIGLSICKRIIADHGGTLEAATSEWGGAEFRIHIPIENRQ